MCAIAVVVFWSCGSEQGQEAKAPEKKLRTNNDYIRTTRSDLGLGLDKLSEYGFFEEPLRTLTPVEDVVPYTLNTPLFSDYALKKRFVRLPEGAQATYHPTEVMDFPEGTVLIKNFYYPADFNQPEADQKIIETRLLIKEGAQWKPLSYIWNDEQTEAYLEVTGGIVDVNWRTADGLIQKAAYSIPNLNQCKNCHAYNQEVRPIGPTARQLNGELEYAHATANQLEHWAARGMLDQLPEVSARPQLAVWNDPASGSLEDRARAYLDINCGSCHRAEGTGNTSGLFLTYHQDANSRAYGLKKSPVAAGRGSGGLQYDIFPGKPEASILLHRMASTDPGVMMPEIGRGLVHEEGVALIEEWIRSLGD